jgi:hypothetical protein
LVCHKEETVMRAYESLIREAERDSKFARRLRESARRTIAFKKRLMKPGKGSASVGRNAPPTPARVEKLARQLWEFGEEIRMAALARTGEKNASKNKDRA